MDNEQYYRTTAGFDPADYMIDLNESCGADPNYYLKTQWRIQWFLTYCAEHGINGMIDDSQVSIIGTPPTQFWLAKAAVFMDSVNVGCSVAAVPLLDEKGMLDADAAQTAATFAKGRALTNAGFGPAAVFQMTGAFLPGHDDEEGVTEDASAYADVGVNPMAFVNPQRNTSENPMTVVYATAPVNQPQMVAQQDGGYPMGQEYTGTTSPQTASQPIKPMSQHSAQYQQPVAAQPAIQEAQSVPYQQAAAQVQPSPQETIPQQAPNLPAIQPLTKEQAREVQIPTGQNAGKTMGEVLLSNPGFLDWVLGRPSYCQRYPMVAAAAQALKVN